MRVSTVPPVADLIEIDLFDDSHWLLAFDGRVFEMFGPFEAQLDVHAHTDDAWRVHVKQLCVEVAEPIKDGTRWVGFRSTAQGAGFTYEQGQPLQWHPKKGSDVLQGWHLDDAAFARITPLLDALVRAGAGSLTA